MAAARYVLAFAGVALIATVILMARQSRRRSHRGVDLDQMSRLRQAELALSAAGSTEAAARELAEHTVALLQPGAAIVIIEGVGETVRVGAGAADRSPELVYEAGSRMRLLDDHGVPCGSIAVSARADGSAYDERDERILDALAERVSSTLHRLSLFEAVRTERRTLEDVLASSSDGIFSVGADMQVRSWNPAMVRITGTPERAAIGHHCCSVFRPTDASGQPRHGAGCPGRSGAPVEDLLVTIDDTDGQPRWVSCTYSPMSEGGYVVVARDVTARKQVEDDKADFLATVSHELRTPLTPLKGFLRTLIGRDTQFASEERQRVYEMMLREQERLERLVQQLLQATSLEDPARLHNAEVLDWPTLAADQVDRFREQDAGRELTFEAAIAAGPAIGDLGLAQQVLANLLSNALKYSPPDTAVRTVVDARGDEIVTRVIDQGPGIAAADRERVFEKFTRLGDHLTRPQQGVGLGLYITRRSVESMGGRVWVEETPGGGATFAFTMPAAPRAADSEPVSSR